MILALLVASVMQPAACHTITTDRIVGKDLIAVVPAFAGLPPDLPLGYSPSPGQVRIFHPAELRRIAAANHLDANPTDDVCFAWQVSVPTKDKILAAVKKTLAGRNADIEIVDQSMAEAPEGEIVFPISGLTGISEEALIWRGYVTYAGDRRFNIWARVRIRVRETHIVATEPLLPGVAITSDQVKTAPYDGPLLRDKLLTDLSAVVGMIPHRVIPAGGVLIETDIDKPRDVERGDTVEVIAESGLARIEAQGIAEEAGRRGAVITVKNATSGKTFRARVDDKGKVTVVPGSFVGLAVEEHKS